MLKRNKLALKSLALGLLCLTLLSGCGFKLCNPCTEDGAPLVAVRLVAHQPEHLFAQRLRESLLQRGILSDAGPVLEVSAVAESTRLLASSIDGSPLEYEIRVSGQFRNYPALAEERPMWQPFEARRTYLYNADNLLSNQAEERILREDMYQRIIEVVLRSTALAEQP